MCQAAWCLRITACMGARRRHRCWSTDDVYVRAGLDQLAGVVMRGVRDCLLCGAGDDCDRAFGRCRSCRRREALPDHLHSVSGEDSVCGDDWEILFEGLGDQKAIEWVFVEVWEKLQAKQVARFNGQQKERLRFNFIQQGSDRRANLRQIAFSDLDCAFPKRCGTDVKDGICCGNDLSCCSGDSFRTRNRPEECVRIQQYFHSSPLVENGASHMSVSSSLPCASIVVPNPRAG